MSSFNLAWPPGIQAQMQAALDGYMNNIGGRPCILYYPPTPQPLPAGYSENPIADFPNSYASAGNPQWGNTLQGQSVYGGGNNFRMVESSGIVTMLVYDKPSVFNRIFPVGERHPEGSIMTRGFVSDLPNILNAVRMETYLVGLTHYNFKLDGEPRFPGKIVPNRYFYAMWMRA